MFALVQRWSSRQRLVQWLEGMQAATRTEGIICAATNHTAVLAALSTLKHYTVVRYETKISPWVQRKRDRRQSGAGVHWCQVYAVLCCAYRRQKNKPLVFWDRVKTLIGQKRAQTLAGRGNRSAMFYSQQAVSGKVWIFSYMCICIYIHIDDNGNPYRNGWSGRLVLFWKLFWSLLLIKHIKTGENR